LLNPVRTLGSTSIFLFLTEKEKCKSIPVAGTGGKTMTVAGTKWQIKAQTLRGLCFLCF